MEHAPTGVKATVDHPTVKAGESFVLTASATDPDGDVTTFTWTVDKVSGWSKSGSPVEMTADGEFEPGTYVFTVTATDGHHPTKPTDTVTVTIEKEAEPDNMTLIIIIAAVLVIIVVAALFFIFRKKEEEGGVEERIESPARKEITMLEPESVPQDAAKASSPTEEYEIEEFDEIPKSATSNSQENEEIENLEALAEDLDKSDACPECGATLGANDMKCANCGAEFDLELECPGCKSPLGSTDKKCPGCGMQFE
jgi:hypothetical protein